MRTPLKVIFVEDDENDLELTLRELRQGGYEVGWKRAETGDDLDVMLTDESWDLIICDHLMPEFSALQALEVLRSKGSEIPFIVVSEAASEEEVTEAMRAGAQDFISKNRLARLVPAVQRELRTAAIRDQRQQMGKRLADIEGRYQALFNENPLPLLLVDARTLLIVDANHAASDFLAYPLQTLRQTKVIAFSLTPVSNGWQTIQRSQDQHSCRFPDQVLRKGGDIRDVDVFAVKIVQGGRDLLLTTLLDRADRKAAEQALVESEARFNRLADSTPMLIRTSGLDAQCDYFNRPWMELRGRRLEEEIGEGWLEGVHPEDRDSCLQACQAAFAEHRAFEMEYRLLHRDGEYRWVLDKGLPRFAQGDEFTGYINFCLDITDRKTALESMAMLVAAVDQVGEAIAVTDLHGKIAYANKAFQSLTGFAASAIMGWAVVDLLERDEIRNALHQASLGVSWEGQATIRTEAGQTLDVDMTCSPVRNDLGEVIQLVLAMRDITKEAELERELRQSQKMEALGSLAAGIAHDSNNILTTILTAAELIKWKLGANSPVQSKVDIILQAVLCAAGLNKQILSFSRKSEGKCLPFDLSMVARDALQMLRGAVPAGVEIRSELTSGIWVEGDPALLKQIVLDLAINAYHAMRPNGGVLQVSLSDTSPEDRSAGPLPLEGHMAMLTVRDTGCGMDAQTLERIFDPFFTTKPQSEGTGLGLSMTHAAVTKAGGRIVVQSEPGKGSEFRIYWPCATGREVPAGGQLPEDVGGTESILFVDDEELVSLLAKLGLQELGYAVTTRTDPKAALEELAAHPDAYDLVFTDLAMPGMSGVDLACRIHELSPETPVLLVSGLPLGPALSLNGSAKFQGIVAKPFTAVDLAGAARKVFAHRPAVQGKSERTQTAAPGQGTSRQEPVVLLAEDSQTTRSMVKAWLERAGYRVVAAKNGLEAWEHFTQGPDRGRFSLVLTDVVMPKMDGLELTQLLRKNDPSIPIGILTSNEDRETVESALNLGVNEFLNKPFESDKLIHCVEHLMDLGRSRTTARRSAETVQAVRLAQKALVAVPEKDLPLFSIYEPLSDAGGDLFRCLKCADDSILFALADVAGHSVLSSYAVASFLAMMSAHVTECRALNTSLAGSGFRDGDTSSVLHCCGHFGKIPCDPLRHLALKFNQGIQAGPFSEVPICALLGLWTPATGQLRLLNAGIPHGLLGKRASRELAPVAINGTPLGIFAEPLVDECTLQLEAGDRLLFGTDGFFEVVSPSGGSFQDVVVPRWGTLWDVPVDLALSEICGEARNHGGGLIADDLMVVGFEQPPLTQKIGELVLQLPSTARTVDLACDRLARFLWASTLGLELEKSRQFDILLAVREALTNAVIHGNHNRAQSTLRLHCRREWDPAALVISVTDEGVGFDLENYAPPQDPLSERGRGIPLIRTFAQDVRMDGGQLTMTFQLQEMAHDNQ